MAFEPTREDQLTEQKLNWGYWWVTHKLQVRRWTAVALAIVDVALIGYASYGYADWFFGSGERERQGTAQLARQAIDMPYFREKFAPQPLVIEEPQVLAGGDRAYDLVGSVANPSMLWLVEFDYHFESSAGTLPVQRGYVLPGDVRPFAALGVKSESFPSGAQLVVENVQWRRVDLHKTRPDYPTWAADRLRLSVSEPAFVPPLPTDPIAVNRVRFTVTNETGFGYYKVGFFVTLVSGGNTVAVNKVTISELRPGESRQVEASWFSDVPSVSAIEVKPELNIFDERNFIAPGQ